jgi:MFS transporter, DHA1 family, tetracycline resistance protein
MKTGSIRLPVLLTIFLDFFNLGLIYPIFSSLIFKDQTGLLPPDASEFYRNCLFGILVATFPFGQLFGAPVIGQLSDFYGRRKLLILSLIGTIATLMLCAFGVLFSSFAILLLGRFIGGLMAGNMTIAYAALSDCASEKEKVRNFALIPFAASAGFALGPLLAALLANFGPATPFFFATLLSFINLILVVQKFPKSSSMKTDTKPLKSIALGLTNLLKIVQPSKERPYLWMLFLMISANFLFVQFIGPYGIDKFHIDVAGVGYLYTNAGLGAALGNLFLTRRLAHHLSAEKALAGGLICLAILLIALILSPNLIMIHIITFLILVACAVGYTNAMTLVSNQAAQHRQGETMGIAVSVQCCSEFLPAFLVGFVAAFSQNLPMLVAALCAAGCFLILRSITKKKEQKHERS